MIGHLVSNNRQSPPDFGIAAFLRKAISGLQPVTHRLLAPLADALHHPRKYPQ